MKRHLLIASAVLALGTVPALADCREELAQLQGGVSKDGSMAPLQSPGEATPQQGSAAATGAESTEGVAKDGTGTPLGTDPNLATSAEDAQAQSQGGDTAAAQAAGTGDAGGTEKPDALARAQAALDAGDEAACMAAVEEAKGM